MEPTKCSQGDSATTLFKSPLDALKFAREFDLDWVGNRTETPWPEDLEEGVYEVVKNEDDENLPLFRGLRCTSSSSSP